MDELGKLVVLFTSLAGLGGLITFGINTAKSLGWVPDGAAVKIHTGASLVAVVALYVLTNFFPQVDIGQVDQIAGTVAEIGLLVMGLIVQIKSGKLTHEVVKGVPVIGKSYSHDALKLAAG